jgi:hypothetical protein
MDVMGLTSIHDPKSWGILSYGVSIDAIVSIVSGGCISTIKQERKPVRV